MNACGLVHSNLFTVPVTVVGFAMLYMAVEWCANEGTAPGSIPSAMARAVIRKFISLKPPSLFLEVLAVIGIVLAYKLIHFGHIGAKREPSADGPGLHEHVRIFQRGRILQRVVIGAGKTL